LKPDLHGERLTPYSLSPGIANILEDEPAASIFRADEWAEGRRG
jgi:hypothetical protein